MKETIKELFNQQSKVVDREGILDKALRSLKATFSGDIPEYMTPTLDALTTELNSVTTHKKAISSAINAIQSVCTHTLPNGETAMVYEGHDSHKDYYQCSICHKGDSY